MQLSIYCILCNIQGIKELQENLFDVTLQQQYMGEQIPEVWLTFENTVIE
jgi:hypothetical protein